MRRLPLSAGLLAAFILSGPAMGRAQSPAPADSLLVSDIVAAESTVDSLRLEIRKLDREIQSMKQDFADGRDVEELLSVLAGEDSANPDAPEDIRSRRGRVDTLLKAITQRPGQLRFNGGATAVMQGLVDGDQDGSAGTGSLDLFAHTSFGPQTLLFFAFEAGGGEGLDAVLPLGSPFNADAVSTRGPEGYDQLVMNEAWAEFTALESAITLTVGKLDITNYFDLNGVANDETAQFLSGAFVNNAAFLAPPPGPGLRARTVLFGRISVQGGWVSADSTGGTRFRDTFAVGSFGLKVLPDSDFNHNLRMYVYAPANQGGATGWGASLDQAVSARWRLFGRYGHNHSGLHDVAVFRESFSGGGEWRGALAARPVVVGGAWGRALAVGSGREENFEAYVSWQANTWTFISTHLQVARNSATMDRPATGLGLRVQFNF